MHMCLHTHVTEQLCALLSRKDWVAAERDEWAESGNKGPGIPPWRCGYLASSGTKLIPGKQATCLLFLTLTPHTAKSIIQQTPIKQTPSWAQHSQTTLGEHTVILKAVVDAWGVGPAHKDRPPSLH